METSRDDFGIAIRSAFLREATKGRFSLLALIILSIILLFLESIKLKPIDYFKSFLRDTIYRSSIIVSSPLTGFKYISNEIGNHVNVYKNYAQLKKEHALLKDKILESDFLILENTQLRNLLDEQVNSPSNLVSSRVIIDKQSPYLNSFIINSGSNRKIINGTPVLEGKNFIGRIVDVNFFSSRVLLVTDLNSKIPVIIEPSGHHAILSGQGNKKPILEYLPENHKVVDGDKVYTSGREGIFSPGIPIGQVILKEKKLKVSLFSDLSQITFVNIDINNFNSDK